MSTTGKPRTGTLIALGVASIMTACSLLVNTDKDQCASDGDCAATAGAQCRQGVCVLSDALLDGGGDAPTDGPTTIDADDGCVPKVPVSDEDFLNEKCTSAQCIDFDNCARLGLCPGDSGLPPLVTPPVGGI
jgi:hypothetical protein